MSNRASKKRSLWRRLAFFAIFLAALYGVVSVVVAYSIWHPVRIPLHTTPAAYGLQYEDVEFRSVGDEIPLKGWFIDSPGDKTILVMHGSNSVKDNYIGT